jgi:hemerythrin-like domain-containing protein
MLNNLKIFCHFISYINTFKKFKIKIKIKIFKIIIRLIRPIIKKYDLFSKYYRRIIMQTPTQNLMHDHETILQSLKITESMAKQARKGVDIEAEDVKQVVEFLKLFADKFHHGKEEDMLFPALCDEGFSKDFGPVAIMLHEHIEGRNFIRLMNDSVSGETVDKKVFADAALGYTYLLRSHIDKENNILFPMGDQRLPQIIQQELMERFRIHEENAIPKEKLDELHSSIYQLQVKYLSVKE